MNKITMPAPSAWMLATQTMGGDIGWKLSWSQSGAGVCNRLSGESHEKALITAAQAEAYANAKVNEALEKAAAIADAQYKESRTAYASSKNPYHEGAADAAGFIEAGIHALIKQDPTGENNV